MDILVTGATGVLGRPTVRLLVAEGHRVHALSRSARNVSLLRSLGAEPVHGELFDAQPLREPMAGCAAVLHLATRIPPTSRAWRRSAWNENDHIRREGTRNLMLAAREASVSTFIYPSVCFLYPESADAWVDADTPPMLDTVIRSTLAAEAEVARFAAEDGRRGITLRLGLLYGPGLGSTDDMLRFARLGIVPLPGRPAAYAPMLWIEDAASALVAALERAPSGIYDVVDDEPLRHAEVYGAIGRGVGRSRLLRLPDALMRLGGGPGMVPLARSQRVTNQRFKEATGWKPAVHDARVGWARLAGPTRPGEVVVRHDGAA